MQLETLYKIINNIAEASLLGERKVLYLLCFCMGMYVYLDVCTMGDVWRSWDPVFSPPCRSWVERMSLDLTASPFAY